MLVKAKRNVVDAVGWHLCGEVFETKEDLGDAVEVLIPEAEKPKRKPAEKPAEEAPAEKPEVKQETPKPKSPARRKVSK